MAGTVGVVGVLRICSGDGRWVGALPCSSFVAGTAGVGVQTMGNKQKKVMFARRINAECGCNLRFYDYLLGPKFNSFINHVAFYYSVKGSCFQKFVHSKNAERSKTEKLRNNSCATVNLCLAKDAN